MDKTIKFTIKQDEIVISIDKKSFAINMDTRIINAKDIYDLLDYNIGDTYSYEEIDVDGKNRLMLDKLQELFKNITNEISELQIPDKDADMKEKIKTIENDNKQ